MDFSSPILLAQALAGAAVAAAVAALFWPKTAAGAGPSRSRLNTVLNRRKSLRETRRTGERVDSKLDQGRVQAMRRMIEHFNMQEMIENSDLKQRLTQAGFKSRSAPTVFVFISIVLPLGMALVALLWFAVLSPKPFEPTRHGGIALLIMAVGYYGPQMWVKNKADKRIQNMSRAYPDALDLAVICVESGMSMERAFHRVGSEISAQSSDLSEEIGLLNAELGYLGDRSQAYDNFAGRTGVPAIKALTSALVQAERYGTPVGQALRVLADESRSERMSKAEQKAASLPAKLTVPMIVFFLPVLFVVIIGPIAVQMMAGE